MKHARSIRAALSLLLAMALLVGVVPVLADGINIIGTVTVTNSSYVNVRTGGATTYPVVATVLPGSIYPCIGTAPSGWYEILLDNGQTGFVSNNLTSFAPGGTGQYPGGQDTSAIRKTISVTYRTEAGAVLATDYVTLLYGVNIVPANDGKVPAGYTLVSSRRVTVNVDWSGTATPSSVVFTYRPYSVPMTPAPQTTAQLPVYYRDIYGVTLNTQVLSLTPGSRLIRPNAALVLSGYTLVGPADVVVSVSSNMMPMPASVTFIYALTVTPTAAPQAAATVPVYYMSNAGAYLNVAYLTLNPGVNYVMPDNALAGAGYTLQSASPAVVNVSAYGVATPNSVTFVYAPTQVAPPVPTVPPAPPAPSPNMTEVGVVYKDQNGNEIYRTKAYVGNGQNYVSANDAFVPGYTLTSPRQVYVNITAEGYPSPWQVNFTYKSGGNPAPQPQPQPQPQPPSGDTPTYLPNYLKTKPNPGSYPVFTGPGNAFYRVGNATLGGGTIRVYGREGEFALIGYGLSNGGYRIGFVTLSAIPANIVQQLQQLHVTYIAKANVSTSLFVDDPIVSTNRELAKRITAGNTFYLLGYLNDFWAWVEIPNFEGSGKPARGFVSRRSLGV